MCVNIIIGGGNLEVQFKFYCLSFVGLPGAHMCRFGIDNKFNERFRYAQLIH